MKKFAFAILATILLLTACKTSEKVLYLQDVKPGEVINTPQLEALKLLPGDKISVVVTSSSTPQIAQQFNLPIVTVQAGTIANYSNQISLYTIDENGCIDVPSLGRVELKGLTRSEAGAKIQTMLRADLLRDAVVTVSTYDQYVTVLGEVARPGRVSITRDNMTLLEAIGQAGDLTIQARRDQVKVIRQENGETKTYFVDLRSKDIFNSPVYNLRQNDVVYVSPNRVRMGQSTNNDNSVRSISTWLSVSSVLISLGILIFR